MKYELEKYPVFGYWLPFIGFRTYGCNDNGDPVFAQIDEDGNIGTEEGMNITHGKTFFVLGWLGRGLLIQVSA